jgi:hypothetical protein
MRIPMISPGFRFDLAQGASRSGLRTSASWKPRGQPESRLCVVVFFCCFYCGRAGDALRVVQAQRHVHSATGSGLSNEFSVPPQAFAGEINAMGAPRDGFHRTVVMPRNRSTVSP